MGREAAREEKFSKSAATKPRLHPARVGSAMELPAPDIARAKVWLF
jgi:hypothetical protein